MLRRQHHPADALPGLLLVVEDGALPQDGGAVVKLGLEMDVLLRHRQHPARDGQDLAHGPHRLRKRAADPVEGRQEQISEILPREASLRKSVGHQLLHDLVGVGQGQHAVPGVSGGQHAQILSEHAAAAAVVRHGDDGRDVPGIALQAPEHGGKSVAAADGDDPRGPPR